MLSVLAPTRPSHCAPFGYRHLGLSELVDRLLRRIMSPPGLISPLLLPYTNI